MLGPEYAPTFVNGSFEELKGRLVYRPFGRARVLPGKKAAVAHLKFGGALFLVLLAATAGATYLFSLRGLVYTFCGGFALIAAVRNHTLRTFPIAADIAPQWQQIAHRTPSVFFVVYLISSLLVIAWIPFAVVAMNHLGHDVFDFLAALAPIDVTVAAIVCFIAMTWANIVMLRFKWRHRHTETPPGIMSAPRREPRSIRRDSIIRYWLAVAFLTIGPMSHEIGEIGSALTSDKTYSFNADSFTGLNLVCSGLVSFLVVWTVMRPRRRVRYLEIVGVITITSLTSFLTLLGLYFGADYAWGVVTSSDDMPYLLVMFLLYASVFWLFAFYRDELYFPRPDRPKPLRP
jgi:hypothetical protein